VRVDKGAKIGLVQIRGTGSGRMLRSFQGFHIFKAPFPRALPWAILFRPFGAWERTTGYAQLIFRLSP
jgi:hypothetical protein